MSTQEKIKLLIAGPLPPPYHGVIMVFKNLLESDFIKKFKVTFVDTSDHRSIKNIGHFEFKNIFLGFKHSIKFLFYLVFKNPDIVYIANSETFWGFFRDLLFLIPSVFLKKKIILHSHGAHFFDFYNNELSEFYKRVTRWILKRVAGVIVLCPKLKFNYNWIVAEERIFVVGNGIHDFNQRNNIKTLIKTDEIKILYLSNLRKEKGCIDILKSAKYVREKYHNVKFVFVGEWFREEDKREAENIIKEDNLENIIDFKGRLFGDEKEKCYFLSDIFVFPTYYNIESWGLVINEAMAASLPVITTNKACIPEIVQNGVTGFIVPPKQPKILSDYILKLIYDNELRINMGKAGRDRFKKNYSFEKFIDKLESTIIQIHHSSSENKRNNNK